MNMQESLGYLEAPVWSRWRLGLERMQELLYRLGDPQNKLRFVHVAGTNGKGSTCAMVESILRSAGYRTGFFSSPVIEDFREQIRTGGEWITEEALCRLTEQIREAAESMEDHPSRYEMITALGFLYFAERQCDIVILETGLGGRYDATNVIRAPEAAVITNIGLDHTDYLGTTLAEIAENKAGIIKTGAEVIAYPGDPDALSVIRKTCAGKGCPLTIADFSRLQVTAQDLNGQRFLWARRLAGTGEDAGSKNAELQLPLIGRYQLNNAAVALTAAEVLQKRGWKITDNAVREGMAQVQWPARFELLRQDPPFILDGGHNRQCAEAAAESLQAYLPEVRPLLLIGMLRDKDYQGALDILLPLTGDCICITPCNERALPAEELAAVIEKKGYYAASAGSIQEALEWCDLTEGPVFAFGSLYMAGEIRKEFKNRQSDKTTSESIPIHWQQNSQG